MATVLPVGKKLMHVDLVVTWFESHRVVGPIHIAFLEYKQLSKLRYVHADATVAIIGPTELANRWSVDELTMVRVQQKIFYQSVQETAETLVIENPKTFDEKMTLLKDIRPDQLLAINNLAGQFLYKWRMSLAFDIKLNETMPGLHQTLEARKNFIDVAHELNWITKTTKDIGEIVRDYRNYIHPQKEFSHGIELQAGDAKMLWEVAKSIAIQLL